MRPYYQNNKAMIYHGDCISVLPQIETESVDAVITDPPYPHIRRDYGTWTTEKWWELIVEGVVPEVQRILKPSGSAVFILQPNSEKVGKMRGWLWEFMAWVCREWNMIQDVWWWKMRGLPWVGATKYALMRQSVKACIWCGVPNCYREQNNVLLEPPLETLARFEREDKQNKLSDTRTYTPSGHSVNRRAHYNSMMRKNGVTPYNLLTPKEDYSQISTGAQGHPAGTPLALADWWTRYIVPPGGVVLDPFAGTSTMGVAALQNNASYIGIEKEARYCTISKERLSQPIAVKMI